MPQTPPAAAMHIVAAPVVDAQEAIPLTECVVCLDRTRNATITHGETGHMCCCYDCALDLQWRGDPCPMCRQPIDSVVRQFFS